MVDVYVQVSLFGVWQWENFDLIFILLLYIFIYVQLIVLYFLFVHSSMSVLKRPEGETLSALENKRNVQVTFAFDDNLCNFKKVNHISNNDCLVGALQYKYSLYVLLSMIVKMNIV